jgi:predicted phosphate transport protein (TIGR00153 family)
MFSLIKKRKNKFLRLISEQACLTLEGLEALKKYFETNNLEFADLVTRKEKEADEARRILIDELNRTFVTPFDREDIFNLSRTIDDVLDYAYSTVNEMVIFKVEATPYMLRMGTLLRDSASELYQAVERLEKHPNVSGEHAQRAKALENRVEEIYREALADLFNDVSDLKEMVLIMKLREVYRHLSNASDRGDEAANVIADIVVKIT